MSQSAAKPFNVFTVEEFETDNGTAKSWTRIGAAFPHKEGPGFNVQLKALPVDGKLVLLPPSADEAPAPAPAPAASNRRR